MSVGHVQRAVETAGLPTVSVYVHSFGHIPGLMGASRSLITPFPMGRPLGAPGDGERQLDVLRAALTLLESPQPVIAPYPEPYRSGPG